MAFCIFSFKCTFGISCLFQNLLLICLESGAYPSISVSSLSTSGNILCFWERAASSIGIRRLSTLSPADDPYGKYHILVENKKTCVKLHSKKFMKISSWLSLLTDDSLYAREGSKKKFAVPKAVLI